MIDNIALKNDIKLVIDKLIQFMKNLDLYIVVYNNKEFVSASIIGDAIQTAFEQNTKLKNRIKSVRLKKNLYLPATAELMQVIILINNDQINSIDYQYGPVDISGVLKSRTCFKLILNLQYSEYHDTISYIANEMKKYISTKKTET